VNFSTLISASANTGFVEALIATPLATGFARAVECHLSVGTEFN
jgi:hypothetical protein